MSKITEPLVAQVEDQPLDNNFISIKKSRLSVVVPALVDEVPRLLVAPKHDMFMTYYDLRTKLEDKNNDLERRLHTTYGGLLKAQPQFRAVSVEESDGGLPIPDLSHITNPLELSSRNQLVIIHRDVLANNEDEVSDILGDFGLVYDDEEGNLVRPPFINVDPRERYQILQMKREVETVNAYKSTMRYAQDPHETSSKSVGNKVETSTQTHTVDLLYNNLNFVKRVAVAPQSTKVKKRKPILAAHLRYDVDMPKVTKKAANALDGYLGGVSKPKFTEKKSIKTINGPIRDDLILLNREKPVLDKEYIERSKQVSDLLNLKKQLILKTLTSSPGAGFNLNVSKLADANIPEPAKKTDETFLFGKPSDLQKTPSLFLFGKSSDLEKPLALLLFGKATEKTTDNTTDKPTEKPLLFGNSEKPADSAKSLFLFSTKLSNATAPTLEPAKLILFGAATEKPLAPAFSFPKTNSDTSDRPLKRRVTDEAETTVEPASKKLFSFDKNSSDKSEPAKLDFSSGSTKPSSFSFGTTEKAATDSAPLLGAKTSESAKPAFSFSTAAANKDLSTPAFLFGKLTDKPKPTEKPSVLFGDKPTQSTDKPTILFGTKPAESSEKPLFLFGTKPAELSEKPLFLFSAKPAETEKPLLLFGTKPSDSLTKPLFSFGAKPNSDNDAEQSEEKAATKPSFLFGTKSGVSSSNPVVDTEDSKTTKSAFLFGKPVTSDGDLTKPLSFGTKPADGSKTAQLSKPAFSFATTGATIGTDKPAFSFGNVGNKTKEPLSFGDKSKDKPESTTTFGSKALTGFSFGDSSKPAFGTTPVTATSTPQLLVNPSQPFSFGKTDSKTSIPAMPSASLFGFGNTAKPSFGGSNTFANNNPSSTFNQPSSAINGVSNQNNNNGFGSNALTPAPSFGFNSRESTPVGNPGFKFAKGASGAVFNNAPGFGQNENLFGNLSTPGFGNNNANSNPRFNQGGGFLSGFSQNNSQNNQLVGNNSGFQQGGFGNNNNNTFSNPSTRQLTPGTQFNFGNASVPQFGGSTPSNGMNQGGFNFGASKQPTPEFGGDPQVLGGTPPVPGGNRKFAQMRQRRRYGGQH